MKVLVELRPALDGHAGIPQETRLLYRALAAMPGVEVEGLIQSSNKVLPLPPDPAPGRPASEVIDGQSRVVVALQQHEQMNRLEWLGQVMQRVLVPARTALRSMFGLKTRLGRFDPAQFGDFVWRSFFAKSLPPDDRPLVSSRPLRVVRSPWSAMHLAGLLTHRVGRAVYPTLDTRGLDAFVVETPYPGRVRAPTRLIVRYHDAIPLLMPHTIHRRLYHQASHYHALKRNVRDGAWFACVSEATRRDLVSVFPEAEPRAVVIHNMVSHHFFDEPSAAERVPEIIWSRRNRAAPQGGGGAVPERDLKDGRVEYLLVVSTIEPRKNHVTVLEAWERLRTNQRPNLNLVFVGHLGWDHGAMLRRMTPWLERGGLHLLEDVPAEDLRVLYRHASATVCPSFYEGFDFAGVEAMASGGVVIASDIAVHREVYADAALYFDAYSSALLHDQLQATLTRETASEREGRIKVGLECVKRFRPQAIEPHWQALLRRLP